MTNDEKTEVHRMLAEMTGAGVVETTYEIGATVYLEESEPHLPLAYKVVTVPPHRIKLAHALWKEHGSVPESVWRASGFRITEERVVPFTEDLKTLVCAAELITAGVARYGSLPEHPGGPGTRVPELFLNLMLLDIHGLDKDPVPQDQIVALHSIWQDWGIEGLVKWACERGGVEYHPGARRL